MVEVDHPVQTKIAGDALGSIAQTMTLHTDCHQHDTNMMDKWQRRAIFHCIHSVPCGSRMTGASFINAQTTSGENLP